jgi:hypothetical protein
MNTIFQNNCLKGVPMMHKIFASLLCAAAAASASAVSDNQRTLDQKVDSIQASRGVQIGGSIRGVAQASYLNSDQDKDGINNMPDVERNEFVSADFDFHFRPWEMVRANVMLRLEAGMQDYFSSPSKSITAGWMNIEGNLGSNFYWVVGDFRQQYSPLTLYSPDVEILYEPKVYSRSRYMAKEQALISGNQRNLEGVNLQYRHFFNEAVGEFRAEGLFSRLRRVQQLDSTGENGNILPNDTLAGSSQSSNMDKWAGAVNLELYPLNRNLMVGFTGMYIFDDKRSFSYTYRHPGGNLNEDYALEYVNAHALDPQSTAVYSFRAGADGAALLHNDALVLDLTSEFALSRDDIYHSVVTANSAESTTVDRVSKTLNGYAFLTSVNAGYKLGGDMKVVLSGDVVVNDSNWFNNLAQSPQFFPRRILNSDKDGNTIKYGVNSPLYSTFDALYHFSPKFSPVALSLGNDDNHMASGQSASYNIASFKKSSWTTNVYTRDELALINSMSDPALQTVLPNGLATANRTGVRGNVTFDMNDYLEAQVLFSTFTETKAETGWDKADFSEYGAGAKWNVFKMLGFTKPLEISGSYKHTNRTQDALAGGSAELNCDFVNAGLSAQYLPRLGVTAGFQLINMKLNDEASVVRAVAAPGTNVPLVKGVQKQWMVGLDYTLADNVWLALNYGMIFVDNSYNVTGIGSDTFSNANNAAYTNLPDYAELTAGMTTYKHSFSESILEASINVEF